MQEFFLKSLFTRWNSNRAPAVWVYAYHTSGCYIVHTFHQVITARFLSNDTASCACKFTTSLTHSQHLTPPLIANLFCPIKDVPYLRRSFPDLSRFSPLPSSLAAVTLTSTIIIFYKIYTILRKLVCRHGARLTSRCANKSSTVLNRAPWLWILRHKAILNIINREQ